MVFKCFIRLCKEVNQQLVGIYKRVMHALVFGVAVFMVIRQTLAAIAKALRWFDRMRVVVAKYALTERLMQCEAVANTVWNIWRDHDRPRFDLDPIPICAVNS